MDTNEPIRAEKKQNLGQIDSAAPNTVNILTTARRNPALSIDGITSFDYRTCGHPKGWPNPCSPAYDPEAVKCGGTSWGTADFDRFMFYEIAEADCLDPTIDLNDETLGVVTEGTAWAVATELESSPWSGNPNLQNTATLLNPAGALSPQGGLSLGLQAVGATGLGVGSVVVPLHALPAVQQWMSNQSGRTLGPGGIRVVTGQGLTGNNLSDINVPGEATIYFIGSIVEYNLSTPQWLYANGPNRAHRLNSSAQEAFRYGKLRFNPSCVYAVRICLADESCCAPVEEIPPADDTAETVKRVPQTSGPVNGVTGLAGVLPRAEKPAETKTEPATDTAKTADRQEQTGPETTVSRETITPELVADSTVDQLRQQADTADRAKAVLELELAADNPRTTLIASMRQLLEEDTPTDG